MKYIRVIGGNTTYPFQPASLVALYPNTSFPHPITGVDLSTYGVFPVTEVAPPAFNPLTHRQVEDTPAEVNGVWTQQWNTIALNPTQAANKLNQARNQRLQELRDIRMVKATSGGIFTNNQWYPCDAVSRTQVLWVLAVGAGSTGQKIELLDGTIANLTFNRAQALLAEDAIRMAAIAARFDVLRAEINASNDPATVDITVGWPAVYVPG